MKKLNFVLTIIGTLLVAQSIFAQETSLARIGVVDMNKLVQESPQAQDMLSVIEEEFAPRVREITSKESALNASKDQLNQDNLALSNDERQNKMISINADQREFEYLQKSIQEDQSLRIRIEQGKIYSEMLNVIRKFGRDNSYDLIINEGTFSQNTILNGGTLYKGASVDITNDIAKMLEKKFQENKAGG